MLLSLFVLVGCAAAPKKPVTIEKKLMSTPKNIFLGSFSGKWKNIMFRG
jgi:uncharacterized protein YcfL